MIEKLFKLKENNTDVRTEVIAGITTFMTMAYIICVQPAILSTVGMDFKSVMVATCLASAIGCFLMALLANYPIALAPAMGHNVYFTYVACPFIAGLLGADSRVLPWQAALGAVFISGVIFILCALFGFRENIIKAVPLSLRHAITVGIGLLIAMIGFEWSGLTIPDPVVYVKLGSFKNPAVLLSIFGVMSISALLVLNVRGAMLIGMLLTAFLGSMLGLLEYKGIVSPVPSIMPTFMKLNIKSVLGIGFLEIIFVFFFLDLFDTVGTLIGVGEKGGFTKNGELPRARGALLADAAATVAGAGLGTSTVSSYIESVAGISSGGRTGLTSIVTGVLMVLAVFFHPIVSMVGGGYRVSENHFLYPVVAPAMIIVGVMMMSSVRNIDWDRYSESIPSFLTIAAMPFCGFSITEGIAFGFISYVLLNIIAGRARAIHPLLYVFSVLFIIRYAYLNA
ncbi:MAG: NCS2 family permease [Candidatus Omnitrophica bacterium]|nr:NCS2 family permease [Candidatus Omnitrophota bacterium]